jgi:uncharacterized protein (DUF779 family)
MGCCEGKTPLARPRSKWNSNTELDLKDVHWEGVSWINLAQDTNKWWAVNIVFT